MTANQISVTPGFSGNEYWLDFQGPLVVQNGATADYGLQYKVAVGPRSLGLITMIDQAYTLTGGAGTILIGETVWSAGFFAGTQLAQSTLSITDVIDPPGEVIQGDNLFIIPGVRQAWITKDIFLQANQGVGNGVGVTIVHQSFHQNIPDGGMTLILCGTAFSALAGMRRLLKR